MIKINKERCIGCGLCVSLCPDVFELTKNGKSKIKKNANIEKNKEDIKKAKKNCPVEAIEISN